MTESFPGRQNVRNKKNERMKEHTQRKKMCKLVVRCE